jgi:dCMP deaminase
MSHLKGVTGLHGGSLTARTRPGSFEYFLRMARLVATRGTCIRRQVGCVLVDSHSRVIATGYNGVASGLPHCIDKPCAGARSLSGQDLHLCEATHAEANALISCRHPEDIVIAFCTTSPCVQCTRLLLNTSCQHIVFIEEYPHVEAKALWEFMGRRWDQYTVEKHPD